MVLPLPQKGFFLKWVNLLNNLIAERPFNTPTNFETLNFVALKSAIGHGLPVHLTLQHRSLAAHKKSLLNHKLRGPYFLLIFGIYI